MQAVRGVVTATQVPRLEALTQDSHCPVQATLQHTPSDPHTPLAQSAPVPVQVSPFGFPTQVPFEQTGVLPAQPPQQAALAMQALLHGFCPEGQVDAQTVPPLWQPKAHVIEVGAVQAPLPLHNAAVVAIPPVQEAAAPHEVALVGNTQAVRLVPSHWPAQAPVPPQGERGVVTATQVPRLAVLTQDSHCPLQATLQQTPSEPHTPLAHSVPAPHAVPLVFAGAPPVPAPAPPVAAPPVPAPPVPAPPRPPLAAVVPAFPPTAEPPEPPAFAPPVPLPPPLPFGVPPDPAPPAWEPPVPIAAPLPPLPGAPVPPVPLVPPLLPLLPPVPMYLGTSPQDITSAPLIRKVTTPKTPLRFMRAYCLSSRNSQARSQ